MTPLHLATLAACAGLLALILYLLRAARSPERTSGRLALLLALLATSLLGWNLASVLDVVSGDPGWARADVAISPWSLPLALHLVLALVGEARRHRFALVLAYGYFGLLSVSVVVLPALGGPDLGLERRWVLFFGAGFVPVSVFILTLLLRHLSRAHTSSERQAARMLLLALAAAVAFGSTDLLAAWGVPLAPMMGIGTLVVVLLLTAVALRLEIVGQMRAAAVVAVGLGLMGLTAYVAAFRVLRSNIAMLVLATALATLALAGVVVNLRQGVVVRRRRMLELATLGTFSAQMAHDLQNPLAALQGAVQFLAEERRRGGDLAAMDRILDLVGAQTRRLSRIVDEYRRMGRVEPVPVPTDLAALVRGISELQEFAGRPEVEMHLDLEPALRSCRVDADLLARALENVVRNAYEAFPGPGRVEVSTRRLERDIQIVVRDTGPGMHPRVLERASDAFFTTKRHGSGLGLSFARRVLEAHGGTLEVRSRPGQGAEVVLEIPEPRERTSHGNDVAPSPRGDFAPSAVRLQR